MYQIFNIFTYENTPISREIVDEILSKSGIRQLGLASIREIKRLINDIEIASGEEFIRMEMGILACLLLLLE